MKRKLVVYLDTYYLPVRQHLETLRLAVAACGADGGLFVPTSYEAMKKVSGERERSRLPGNKLRVQLLQALAAGEETLGVEAMLMEHADERVSLRWLGRLQRRYEGVRLCLTLTLEQLYILAKRPERDTLAQRFDFVVLCLEGNDAERAFERSEWLQAHRELFSVAYTPQRPTEAQLAPVREAVFAGDEAGAADVGEAGLALLAEHGFFGSKRIDRFRGERHFLSNFYEAPVVYGGLRYENSEAAYQAQKCCSDAERERFTALRPLEAKSLGREVLLREDWDEVCLDVMEGVLRAKFTQNPELAALLLGTGDCVLVEGNTWGDLFWGVDVRSGEGENHLGRLLMKIRGELST